MFLMVSSLLSLQAIISGWCSGRAQPH